MIVITEFVLCTDDIMIVQRFFRVQLPMVENMAIFIFSILE